MFKLFINDFKIPYEGNNIYKFAKKIFPINRSLTGDGNRLTLKLIKKIIPNLKIKEIPSKTRVYDWTIPEEWNVNDAYIINPNGKKICSFKQNNLHLVGYSQPINKSLNLNQLKKHLHFNKSLPSAIPYVVSYYKKNWGFCISYKEFKKLKKGNYKVVINSKLSKGSMTYGELIIPGKIKKEILLSTYICHPSLANNEISGPSLLTFVGKFLNSLKDRYYTYRLVFHPENIGAIAYISKNFKVLKKNVVAGYVLSCVGDDRSYSFMPSRNGNSLSDKVAKYVLKNYTKKFQEFSFLDIGSDERRYCAPNINLPVCSIMRTKYGNYKEYHTSQDNMSLVSNKGFQGAYNIYLNVIKVLENNHIYITRTKCEPQLGKRDLYPNVSRWPNKKSWSEISKIVNLLSYADGQNDLIDLSEKIKVRADDLFNILNKLIKEDLIKKIK